MVTLGQIREAHSKVKTGADFPRYIQDLIAFGITGYDTYASDRHVEYRTTDGSVIRSDAEHSALTVADTSNAKKFQERLKVHQQGWTSYPTFCADAAGLGVEKWTVDTTAMTCTYYNKSGHTILVEGIPT